MKLLLVILHADSTRGGAELYTLRLFRKLLDAGHDVHLAAATFEASIPLDRRVPLRHAGLTRVGRYRAFLRSLDQHLAHARYDIIHAMLPVPRCDIYQAHAGIESVTIQARPTLARLGNPRRALMARIEADLIARGTLILCPSLQMRRQIPTAQAEVLYSAADDEQFVPRPPAPRSGPVATFIGQDFARKGLEIALRAVAQVEGLVLQVVGRDDPAPGQAIAAQLGIAERIRWLGQRHDIAEILAGSDLFLLPSRHEPFGMVVLEAMLMGVPPIVSSNAGAAEIINDGQDGRIIAGESPDAWAAAIREVLAGRDRFSAACLARRAELSYQGHLQQLTDYYERIVERKHP